MVSFDTVLVAFNATLKKKKKKHLVTCNHQHLLLKHPKQSSMQSHVSAQKAVMHLGIVKNFHTELVGQPGSRFCYSSAVLFTSYLIRTINS